MDCIVCGKHRRHQKEKLCRACLEYYAKKYRVNDYRKLHTVKEYDELVAAYEVLSEVQDAD